MTGYDAARWSDFALGQLGASAALLGLVFVSLSINLRDFIGSRALVNRAAESVVGLGTVLVASTAVLIPAQSHHTVGIEVTITAAVTLAVTVVLQRDAAAPSVDGRPGPPKVSIVIRRLFGLGSAALLLVAGVTLIAEAGGGLSWWPAAVVAAYIGALSNAWVLLIEILR